MEDANGNLQTFISALSVGGASGNPQRRFVTDDGGDLQALISTLFEDGANGNLHTLIPTCFGSTVFFGHATDIAGGRRPA